MGYVAKLTKGIKTLDLSSGIYSLGLDFVPPRANISTYTASGTSANQYGGSGKIGERATNIGFTFSVRVLGGSNAEVEQGVRAIARFLRGAGDEAEPLYFEWRPDNNVGFEPLWGQFGANLRCEVVSGVVDHWGGYGSANIRNRASFAMVALEVKPLILGKRQRVATCKGGIFENTIGTVDGTSRGVIITETTTNKFTNPIFGNSTYSTNWTVSNAALLATQNTDPEYVLFGSSSAKLVAIASGHFWKESINVGNTNAHVISCYVKRPSGDAVSASHCQLVYNTAVTTTFQYVGNGWYRAYAVITGAAAARDCGIQVLGIGGTLYVDGFQLEETSYTSPTTICYGDLLGCSWTSTVHASTSSRSAAYMRVPSGDIWDNRGGTVRCAVRWAYNQDHPSSMTFFDVGSVGAYFDVADNCIKIIDGTNTVASAAVTFAAGDVEIFHFVISRTRVEIYRNGSSIASDTDADAYTPEAPDTYFYIGSSATPGSFFGGTFLGFATYDHAMTATEVSADYSNITEVINGGDGEGVQLEPIPWLWTKDGDDVVDNCDDSTHDNYAICGGIPGDTESDTIYHLTTSAQIQVAGELLLSRIDESYDNLICPGVSFLYYDLSTTSDTTCSGEEKLNVTVGATTDNIDIGTGAAAGNKYLLDKNLYCVTRLASATAHTITLGWRAAYADLNNLDSDSINVSAQTTMRLFFLPPIRMISGGLFSQGILPDTSVRFTEYYLRAYSASSDTISIDYFAVLPEPVLNLDFPASTQTTLLINQTKAWSTTTLAPDWYIPTTGQAVNLLPNRYNILSTFMGSDTDNPVITYTLTYTKVYVIPRYSIT